MYATRQTIRVLGWLSLVACYGSPASAAEFNPVVGAPAGPVRSEGRVIVKLRPEEGSGVARKSASASRTALLAERRGLKVTASRQIGMDLHALVLEAGDDAAALADILSRLRSDPAVEFAEADRRRQRLAIPGDPLFSGQWYLQAAEAAAIDAQGAWDNTTGSAGVVVAVLDTGVLFDHPDLQRATAGGRLLPGYDFISADTDGRFGTANDGDGRDADAADPGDWISQADTARALFASCETGDSSWHGTRVAGIVGALTGNDTGVAGIDWQNWVLPVRVLGKCGGYDSDILAGMRWAAGLHVDGIPDNPYPASIQNLSFGGTASCPASYQSVIDELTANGVLVIAAAGNEGGPVGAPANCDGVVAVTGLRHAGTKVGFSNLGPEVAIGAPAGNCVNVTAGSPCLFPIDTTSNLGTTTAGTHSYTDQYDANLGTSFAAPIVAGIAALMSSVNGNLGPELLAERLKASATPFPQSSDSAVPVCHAPAGTNDIQDSECSCTTAVCGAGMANARVAVSEALRPVAALRLGSSIGSGQEVVLEAGGSAAACNRTITSYAWVLVDGGSNPPAIVGADSQTARIAAPVSGSYTLQLTVTDDAGLTDVVTATLTATALTTMAPTTAGAQACPAVIQVADGDGSGSDTGSENGSSTGTDTPQSSGGGGGISPGLLLLLTAGAVFRRVCGRGCWRRDVSGIATIMLSTISGVRRW